MKKLTYFLISLTSITSILSQNSVIKGKVIDATNNETIPFANVFVEQINSGVASDFDGFYEIENLKPGLYTIKCSFVGYEPVVYAEVIVNPNKPTILDIKLIESSTSLDEVEITASPFQKSEESPVSKRTINATEIYRNPGGNRDISKVITSLPGVASTVSFRNDIIIRGGAPNENRFYLDGIEIPNINHFATQGSSGGPVGMINVNFIREVDLYSGAFPANRGNALSSVLEFKQIDGNPDRIAKTLTVGSSDFGITLDGPVNNKTTFVFSARRSYLQLLFSAIGLPFLPTYNDFQFKTKTKIDDKNQITFIGLGAIDDFVLNKGINDNILSKDSLTVQDYDDIESNNYILGYIPVTTQWNYAVGANWTHFKDNSFQNYVFSRNHLNNRSVKYKDNNEVPDNLLQNYVSEEIENKFRFENTIRKNGWKINFGTGIEHVTFKNNTFQKIIYQNISDTLEFESVLNFVKTSFFGQISKKALDNKLIASFGIRTDQNSYSKEMSNPLKQLSPRLSVAYAIGEKSSLNFNIGQYFQLPAYTVMGYRNNENQLVNKVNEITYINNKHVVFGLETNPGNFSKVTLEGFYKKYDNYPFLLGDSISLANLGGDFGVIGNEPVTSTSEGRSYGIEFLAQKKLNKSFYGILAYTWVRSEFKDKNDNYVPSAWDNKHIISMTGGIKLKNDWEIGMRFRFSGGSPYTPYNDTISSLINVWDVNSFGVFDYNQLNGERLKSNHGLDVRIDKKWYWKKVTLNIYLDIQNLYNFQAETPRSLIVVTDENGNKISDPNDPSRYQIKYLENTAGTLLPSIGIQFEF
ncbi:MAG: ferric aerobactin receptor [Crocinitomicaceae bacterium]|nr:ferric aerobactin receptor [Crocinitomicaceae bacterium]